MLCFEIEVTPDHIRSVSHICVNNFQQKVKTQGLGISPLLFVKTQQNI